jgi:hypothetical protein
MTGTWLRGPSPHSCEPPNDSSISRGAIWRCHCGRRWIVVDRTRTMPAGNGTLGRPGRPVWKRRRLPWPRRTAEERRQAAQQVRGGPYESPPTASKPPSPPPAGPPFGRGEETDRAFAKGTLGLPARDPALPEFGDPRKLPPPFMPDPNLTTREP